MPCALAAVLVAALAAAAAAPAAASSPDVVGTLKLGSVEVNAQVLSGTSFLVELWNKGQTGEPITAFAVDRPQTETADEHCGHSDNCDNVCVIVTKASFGATVSEICVDVHFECGNLGHTAREEAGCLKFVTQFNREELPELPQEWSAVLEANILEKNQTLEMREYYDGDGGRVRQELHHDEASVLHLINAGENSWTEIVGSACQVRPLNETRAAHMLDRSTGRLMSARDMFEAFRSNASYEYSGESAARGIATDYWTGHVNHTFSSRGGHQMGIAYSLEWHFAVPGWNWTHSALHRLPVRAVLNGTEHNLTETGGAWDPAVAKAFYHVYDWVAFDPTRPDEALMRPPDSVACDRLERREIPRGTANFRAAVEHTSARTAKTSTTMEWYDYGRNRARFERGKDSQGREVVELADFENGALFKLKYAADGSVNECETVRLAEALDGYRWVYDEDAHHLRRVDFGHQASVITGEVPNYRYIGPRTIRGIECDGWITDYSDVKLSLGSAGDAVATFTVAVFFAAEGWELQGYDGGRERAVLPVAEQVRGSMRLVDTDAERTISSDTHFTDVDYRAPEDWAFAVPPACPLDGVYSAAAEPASSSDEDGVSKGGAAGLSVAMALVGALIGAAIFHRTDTKRHFSLTSSHSTTSEMAVYD